MEIVVIKTNQDWMIGLEIRIYMFVGIYAFIYECLIKQAKQLMKMMRDTGDGIY